MGQIDWVETAKIGGALLGGPVVMEGFKWVRGRIDGIDKDKRKSRDAHYEDLKDWIQQLEDKLNKAFALVQECEKRHEDLQKTHFDMVMEMTREMSAAKAKLETLERGMQQNQKDRLMAQSMAEMFKAHPALAEELKKNIDEKE